MKTKIYVLPSTHWDREWVLPFEKFRFKLVRLMDRLLDILEKDPDYRVFHLDGQTVLLDDYVALRPENEPRVKKLLSEGRLLVGPFRNMLDCLLPSGEAITRNLQLGLADCLRWGAKPHACGYTCDVFGHNAQMPQIYRNFGIDNCLLFRGRKGYDANRFLWEGADGTRVTVHKADADYTYADFFLVARWPQQDSDSPDLDRMANALKEHLASVNFRYQDIHFMIDGADNLEPDERLPRYLAALNDRLEDFEFVLSDFDDYNAACRASSMPLALSKGILYDSAKEGMSGFVMKNVASSMVQLKQANMSVENLLTFAAEPLDLFTELALGDTEPDGYYAPRPRAAFFDYAWSKLIANHPHDSLGGTCCTATHLDNENDFKRAKENVEVALTDTLAQLARFVKTSGRGKDGAILLYNPSQQAFSGVATVDFKILSGSHSSFFDFYDAEGNRLPHEMLSLQTVTEQVAEHKKLADYFSYDHFALALPLQMKPYSYQVVTYDIPKTERNMAAGEWKCSRMDPVCRPSSTMRTAMDTFDNGALTVRFCPNGTLSVTDRQTGRQYDDLFIFEDTAETGEGWNHREPAFNETIETYASNARISVLTDSKTITRVRVRHTLQLPVRAEGELCRSRQEGEFVLDAVFTLTEGSKQISCRIEVDNRICDHRLRAVFPTRLAADTFKTAMPYGMQEWKIAREDHAYDIEPFTPTVPGHGCLTLCEGENVFSVYAKGLYEFEVSPRPDRAVYLTLFRAIPKETFMLKSDMGELERNLSFAFAIDFTKQNELSALQASRAYQVGILCAPAHGKLERLPFEGSVVEITGGAALSALRARGLLCRQPELRLYDVLGGCQGEVRFAKPLKRAVRLYMDGTELDEAKIVQGNLQYELAAQEIGSWRLEF